MSKSSPKSSAPPAVGITGGISSGKSTVARLWKLFGAPCFHADDEAKIILATQPEVVKEVTNLLGAEAYRSGVPNREYIASRIFGENGLRLSLNQIIHPRVAQAFAEWRSKHSAYPYVLKEAAIVFEIGQQAQYDAVVLVCAPLPLRQKWAMQRGHITVDDFQKRLKAQWADEVKRPLAQHVIENDNSRALIPQVAALHALFLKGEGFKA